MATTAKFTPMIEAPVIGYTLPVLDRDRDLDNEVVTTRPTLAVTEPHVMSSKNLDDFLDYLEENEQWNTTSIELVKEAKRGIHKLYARDIRIHTTWLTFLALEAEALDFVVTPKHTTLDTKSGFGPSRVVRRTPKQKATGKF